MGGRGGWGRKGERRKKGMEVGKKEGRPCEWAGLVTSTISLAQGATANCYLTYF